MFEVRYHDRVVSEGHRRLRVGDWRVVYRVDVAQRIVFVVAIDHLKDIYED
jgi:mRNA interferase RelE/StbE